MTGEVPHIEPPETAEIATPMGAERTTHALAVLSVGESMDQLPSPVELHQSIIVPDAALQPPLPEGQEPVEVAVIGSHHLRIRGTVLGLDINEVFVLNALVHLRKAPEPSSRMVGLGYRASRGMLHRRLQELIEKVNTAAQEPLIIRDDTPRISEYKLDDRLRLLSQPEEGYPQEPLEVTLPTSGKRVLSPGAQQIAATEGYSGQQEQEADDARTQAIKDIVKQYGNHPKVAMMLAKDRQGSQAGPPERLDPMKAALWIGGQYEHIRDKEQLRSLFAAMDKGAEVYRGANAAISAESPQGLELILQAAYAHQRMYLGNLKLVSHYIAHKLAYQTPIAYEDLYSAGSLGLSKAIRRYDPAKGAFSTYAIGGIRQAITRAVEEESRAIRLPGEEHQMWVKLRRSSQALEVELGRSPTIDELAQAAEVDPEEAELLLLRGRMTLPSLNQLVDNAGDNQATLQDLLPGTPDFAPAVVDRMSVRPIIRSLVDTVGMRDRAKATLKAIFTLYYGLPLDTFDDCTVKTGSGRPRQLSDIVTEAVNTYGSAPLSLEKVGNLLGVSKEYVSQVQTRSLPLLRKAADDMGLS